MGVEVEVLVLIVGAHVVGVEVEVEVLVLIATLGAGRPHLNCSIRRRLAPHLCNQPDRTRTPRHLETTD